MYNLNLILKIHGSCFSLYATTTTQCVRQDFDWPGSATYVNRYNKQTQNLPRLKSIYQYMKVGNTTDFVGSNESVKFSKIALWKENIFSH